jgi:MazG family protein
MDRITLSAAESFGRLVDTVRHLRGPDGCPWDRAQTLQTLRPFVLEETYEVLEALDRDDRTALREELGDFVFEAVLLAQLCAESGDFTIGDSVDSITEKLIRRHPHVFARDQPPAGTAQAAPPLTPDEVVGRWEAIKSTESSKDGTARTTLGGVPRTLPSLLRAHEIGTRVAAVGFDWDRTVDVLAKIEEEVAELRQSIESDHADRAHAEEEMGDLLFTIANLSRKLGIEPEAALRQANDKFTRRFETMEAALKAGGRTLDSYSLVQMEDEWGRVKLAERRDAQRGGSSSR